MGCVTHCWHSTHTGPWLGVNPPPQICCHCGRSPESLHGPFAPQGTSYGSTGITTKLSTSTSEGATSTGPKLLFDATTGPTGQSVNNVHGTYLPKNLLNE